MVLSTSENEEYESNLLSSLNVTTTEGIAEAISENATTNTSTEEILKEMGTTLAPSTTIRVEECNRDGYFMVSYSSVYLFLIVMASIFILLVVLIVFTYIVHRRIKRYRLRHGMYKLTTMRNLSEDNKPPRLPISQEMYI